MGYLEDKQALQQYMGDPGNADSPVTVLLHKLNGSVGVDDGSGGSTTLTEIRDQLRILNGAKEGIPVTNTTLFSVASVSGAKIKGLVGINGGFTLASCNASGSQFFSDADLQARYAGVSIATGAYLSFGEISVTEITLTSGGCLVIVEYA